MILAEAELLWVPALGPLLAGAARAEGAEPSATDVTLMIAQVVAGIAAGTIRLFLALSDDPESPGPKVNGQGVAGMVQVDCHAPDLYECRRLYVPAYHRGGRVAWRLLQKAARELEAPRATIVFSAPYPPRAAYLRLGVTLRTCVYQVEITQVRARLKKEKQTWEPRRSLSVSE